MHYFGLRNHSKTQSSKTEKKIICKFAIDTKSGFLPPIYFHDNNINKMLIIANAIIHHIAMSCPNHE